MPTARSPRKKADDTTAAETPADELATDAEPATDDTQAAAGDPTEGTSDDTGPENVDDDPGAGSTPPTADSADNVLYPVKGNDAAQPGPLCPTCFPYGWPAGAEQTVGCEHGLWLRQWPPAAE